ncbi:copper resistance system multicopper oxidase [Steroidobacter sp. S1-65]|uniref:Copper resistance system multicopper oxidase n=2 Tax=Steroidobacter gossypii TaxID=2805490 RepID=A0ABS1WXQ6_9GAMM|nr:copper resistance system multicopper oxidase [Steroidobacter gossypii]MBM0105717.1 copper resistance system multicopper oxidase [Steroidobacter gossypii]
MPSSRARLPQLSRRSFLQAAGAGLFVLGAPRGAGWAQSHAQTVLTGSHFDLQIGEAPFNFTGNKRVGTVVNGQIPGPLLRWREGDTVTLRVANRLAARSSIHWHGMILPADMDGVPGLSFEGIPSLGEYLYRFKVNQAGTYWYHAHSRFQEQTGLYGPIVIERRGGERFPTERDYVVMLSDWTDIDPERIFAVLKKHSDYYNFRRRTVGEFFADVRKNGWSETVADRRMWGEMRMNPTDMLDVSGYAYTYLMNGVTPTGNWTGLFSRGEKVRLRFINGSSMTFFDVRIPGLKLTVVATDGQDVEPVSVDEFRIGAAETYDVIVEPKDDRAYTIFAQAMDRSGYARGTLSPSPGLEAEIPPLDPRPLLTMGDMGMSHGAHAAGSMKPMDHSQMDHGQMNHGQRNHGQRSHGQRSSGETDPHAAHGSSAQRGAVDHAAMGHGASALHHPSTERTPLQDMQAEQPNIGLNDPGVGLRNNGRRVLTYADLHTIGGPIDRREPAREIELHLTGHMERFVWSFNGQKFSEAKPLKFRLGERLRITLVNDSMMTHPIHLHGMWSEIEDASGHFQVRKHTVNVNPAQKLSYAVTADAPGRWAYHCHLLYHMEAGMFREVHVESGDEGGAGGPGAGHGAHS